MKRDTTALQKREQNSAFLLRLSDALRPLADPRAIKETATRLLGSYLQVNRVAYFDVTDTHYVIKAWYVKGASAIPNCYSIDSLGPELYAAYCRGQTAWDSDVQAHDAPSSHGGAELAIFQSGAYIGAPLLKNGVLTAVLSVYSTKSRAWTETEIKLVEEVAERTWAAVQQSWAEARLREARLRHQLLVEGAIGFAMIQLDLNGRVALWNVGAERILGYKEEEILGHHFACFYTPEDRAAGQPEAELWHARNDSDDRGEDDNLLVRRDGGRFWASGATTALYDDRDRLSGYAKIVRDISERKRAEAASNKLAAIVESSDDAIISKDLDGVIQTWNAAAERLFGYTADEAVGQSNTLIVPSERITEGEALFKRVRHGESIEHFQTVRLCRGGTAVDVSLTLSPLKDEAGRVTGIAGVVRDISEHRRAERLRVQQTHLLELIAADTPLDECLEALCRSVSQIGSGVRASVAQIEVARQRFQRPIAPEMQASWNEGLAGMPLEDRRISTCGEAIYSGHAVTSEDIANDERWSDSWRQLCQANGVLAAYSAPVQGENGHMVASFMLCFDQPRKPSVWEQELATFGTRITSIALARTRASEALRQAAQRKDEFLATLAHELRNPLAPLRNGLAVMRREDPRATAKARQIMERQLDQLSYLVNELLDLSRITRGKIELHQTKIDLSSLIREAVETMQPGVDAARQTLCTNLPAEPLTVQADAERLTQVVTNLLNNASKYTPGGGEIDITLERRDSLAVLYVHDTGKGIAGDRLEAIFDMFTQDSQLEGKSNQGLGIGLTLVKQIIELHGGSVEAQSDGPEKGSTFIVCLPLTVEENDHDSAEQSHASVTGRSNLLVVDDNVDVADSLSILLESMGHDVTVAYDGYQALDKIVESPCDAVFLDIGLPGIDGFETARRLRATPAGAAVTLIALTGWGGEVDRNRSLEAGFDHHLVKPVDPDTLEEILAEL